MAKRRTRTKKATKARAKSARKTRRTGARGKKKTAKKRRPTKRATAKKRRTTAKRGKKKPATPRAASGAITTVGGIVRAWARQRPTGVALVQGDRTQTWAELHRRASQVAHGLRRAGVGPQDRVAFLDKNSIAHFEVFYGCALLNAVSCDVNWRLAAPEVLYIVNDAQAKVLVVGQEFVPILDAIAGQLTTATTIIVIGGHPTYRDYESWVAGQPTDDPAAPSKGGDVAFQLYSSGTTGRPKGVMLTNDNFFAFLGKAGEIFRIDGSSVNLVAMPLFHIGGSGWATAGQFFGAASIIQRDIDPGAMLGLIAQHRITHAFMVPALLQFTLMVPAINTTDFSSLKLIAYGASPISEEVLAASLKAFKCAFMQIYGLTETTGVVTLLYPEEHELEGPRKVRLRSCGRPAPGNEVRIVDSDTKKDVPAGEVGEIWIRSKQVMKGYWNMPKETKEVILAGGWFRSGDAGYKDKDGFIYIFDRVKDMIVSGGENVYPAEVENALMSHPSIADVAVIGVPDEKWGEVPKAMVVRKKDPSGAPVGVTEAEIIAFARERLAGFKTPKSVDWVDALPRNPSGKILKKDLREPFWRGRERRVN